MKFPSLLSCALVLAGCAAGPSPQVSAQRAYIEQNRPLAMGGAMKWSTYYKALYALSLEAKTPARDLNRMDDLITAAQQYEAGTMTKDVFEQRRRSAMNGQAADQEAADDAERARRMAFAAAMAAQPPIQSTYQIVPIAPVQSYTPIAQSQQSRGVTAFFTGRQEQVQTVTYQMGWKCEYRYISTTFTRIFPTSCPGSVQVE